MENQRNISEFILLELLYSHNIQIFCFVFFLFCYVVLLVGNFLILFSIQCSPLFNQPGPEGREVGRLGRSPLRNAPDLGAAQTQGSAALPRAPHRMAPPAQRPAPRLFQPRGARAYLVPRLRGRRHRPQAEDAGPGPQGSRAAVGAPRAHTPHCSAPLDHEGRPLFLWAPPGPGRHGIACSWQGGAGEEPDVGAAGCTSGAVGRQV